MYYIVLTIRFSLMLAAVLLARYLVPSVVDSYVMTLLVSLLSFFVFEVASSLVAYRRLCSRLGLLHDIFANADSFANLRYLRWSPFPFWALRYWWQPSMFMTLVRGLSSSLRSWWIWQMIYEVILAALVIGGTAYMLVPDYYYLPLAPAAALAVVALASRRVLAVWEPQKYWS